MPAFDPVRDAVLNSPVSAAKQLNSPITRLSASPGSDSAAASPTLGRRATDLSVLLNAEPQEVLSTPPPRRRSTLSHILLPNDVTDDKLAQVEPFRRPSQELAHLPPSRFPRQTDPSGVQRTSLPQPVQPSVPLPHSQSPVAASSYTAISSHPLPSPDPSPLVDFTTKVPFSTSPSPPPPAPEEVMSPRPANRPYNPVNRITPAVSIKIPLTEAEIDFYNNYYGLGAQKLLGKSRKRERSEEPEDEHLAKKIADDVGMVVSHYNERPDVGIFQRRESPIIGLRNFNNWIKSVLITRFAWPVLANSPVEIKPAGTARGPRGSSGKVLDMGIGKGGDLSKWARVRIRELIGADIAAVSIEQARSRWQSLRGSRFEATFVAFDCYNEPLTRGIPPEKLAHPFDVVSMQFCMHYAFETEQKARCMLENVTKWLRPGGIFIGTIPNASQLLERLESLPPDAEELRFGNSVYSVRFEDRAHKSVYGHRYMFYLRDAVENVPEYLVYWDNFVRLAAEYRLRPVYKKEFHGVFDEHRDHPEFGPLMMKMKVVDAKGESSMDEDQWEAANIYIAFAFERG